LAAYLIAIHLAGERDVDYETLAVVSGVATTFCYHLRDYTGCYVFLPGEDDRIAKATSCQFERTWECGTPEKTWELIRETVDTGTVLQTEVGERMVYAGYQDAPRKGDRKVFALAGFYLIEGKWVKWQEFAHSRQDDPSVSRIVKRVQRAAPVTLAKEVLSNIANWSYNDPRAKNNWLRSISERIGRGGFKWGISGIQAFAADLDDMGLEPDDFSSGWRHSHVILMQWRTRKSASIWLERLAMSKVLQEPATDHLLAAAREYESATVAWREFAKLNWASKEERASMASAVCQAADHEQTAVAAVKQAPAVIS